MTDQQQRIIDTAWQKLAFQLSLFNDKANAEAAAKLAAEGVTLYEWSAEDIAAYNAAAVAAWDDWGTRTPEAGAILEEMKRLPQLFGVIGKVKKVALVSNQKWIRDMAELEGKILPGTTIRSFEFKDRAQAEAYLERADTPDSSDDDTENFPV